MDLGSNFSAKLEPFLLMAKSMKGAAAAKLVEDATAAPGVFVFSELLELPNIQELSKSEQHAKSFRLLEFFAFRTYQDYLQEKNSLPALNQAQTIKLKHLSIVSMASERRILPYSELLQVLQMPTIRELEDLIIDAIYLDILRGKLDQKEEQLEIEYTMGRDLEPGKIESILAALNAWASATAAVLHTLDTKILNIASETEGFKIMQQDHDRILQNNLKDVHEKLKDKNVPRRPFASFEADPQGNGRSLRPSSNAMDIDEPENSKSQGKNRKADTASLTKPSRKRNRF
ncbi:hypothetical protein C8J56DRAFT_816335 [Mycena floridula]|nr:hypothetical protein C8J56DRAFT_816335 [Mycena floridula]